MSQPFEPIPTIVLTGFLGSGKTTLLNRLLAAGPPAAVVINEFGSTPVDQDLLHDQRIPMTVLSGGCLCCQIKGALAPTLKNLWMAWSNASVKPFQRLIIETSGVASPEPILDTLLRDRWLSQRYRLQQIVATLAIPSAAEQLARFAEARAQAAWADVLLLTHADRADAVQNAELERLLQTLAPASPRLQATRQHCDLSALLAVAGPALRRLPSGQALPEHRFRSLSLHLQQTPPWPRLQALLQGLLASHPVELVRIKGVVYPQGQSEPLAVHAAAGCLYPPSPLPPRPGDDARSRLVFIADADIEELTEAVANAFAGCLGNQALRRH